MCGVWLDIQIGVLVGARVVPADVAAGLHRVGDQPLVDDALADHDLGPVDGRVGAGLVADVPLEDDVVGGVLVELRRAIGDGLLHVDDRRQRLPIDLDGLERVVGLGLRVGDHRRDALTGPLDAVGGQDARGADVVLDARAAAGRPGHRERVVGDVRADEHADDAGHRRRTAGVDRADVGVGVGAAEDGHMGHRLELDVVEEATFAGDEAGVLGALDRLAEGGGRGVEHVGHIVVSLPLRGGAGGRAGRGRLAHRHGRGLDREDDVVVAGAATDVALEGVADLVLGGVVVVG